MNLYPATMAAFVLAFPSMDVATKAEITLFNSEGAAVAYIADDLTIYLWEGEPAAYLDRDSSGGFHIYGFNGKHLGWYASGIVRDQKGLVVGEHGRLPELPPQAAWRRDRSSNGPLGS